MRTKEKGSRGKKEDEVDKGAVQAEEEKMVVRKRGTPHLMDKKS